ncbi:MAG TPA: TetR/AcrR family transcriptional regulator [Henriciella marina]|uniref:TetR/AcrR family transcriptional regulator n=1 Tax=Henriciella sp. TaxID=1968823 RepID=UPI0017983EEE|nr:TetR/AcrR family transcriptional regulator [Henriciella sp.]HIG22223.1 TetR/AcrR family transcriptional regulator [Henriciella sp.]HIK65613.1 TetR/AcrR family transcriptional regulator [Henriciella marina]
MTTAEPATSPRKTPRQARAQATYDAVLEAAARILERGGLAELNTNAIAGRAGISVGSLYQYFPSKEAILAELLHRERQSLCAALECHLETSANLGLTDAVRGFLKTAAVHQLARPDLSRTLEYAEFMLPLEEQTRKTNERIAQIVATFLEARGVANAALAAQDVSAMSRGLIDAAGLAEERDEDALVDRLHPAVMGYLKAAGAK